MAMAISRPRTKKSAGYAERVISRLLRFGFTDDAEVVERGRRAATYRIISRQGELSSAQHGTSTTARGRPAVTIEARNTAPTLPRRHASYTIAGRHKA